MKLSTLKQLIKEEIQNLMLEVAKGVNDLPKDISLKIAGDDEGVEIYFVDEKGNEIRDRNAPVWGQLVFDMPPILAGKCDNAYVIQYSETKKGWGPFLYDIGMELATLKAGGLTADRMQVSPDAYKVWNYYLNSRSDVESHQLDARDADITSDKLRGKPISQITPQNKEDDCGQYSSLRSTEDYDLEDWPESPLSKRYTKKGAATLKAMANSGKLDLTDFMGSIPGIKE